MMYLKVVAFHGRLSNEGRRTADNSVFPLTGRGVQRSGFEEEKWFHDVDSGSKFMMWRAHTAEPKSKCH